MRIKKKYLTILSIIGTMLSFASILLYFTLFSSDTLSSLLDFQLSSESLMVYISIISGAIAVIIEIVSAIAIRKEKRRQKQILETVLLYSMMSNKGEDIYHKKITLLEKEELLTFKELQKLETLHKKIAKDNEDATLEEMRESVDGLLFSFD